MEKQLEVQLTTVQQAISRLHECRRQADADHQAWMDGCKSATQSEMHAIRSLHVDVLQRLESLIDCEGWLERELEDHLNSLNTRSLTVGEHLLEDLSSPVPLSALHVACPTCDSKDAEHVIEGDMHSWTESTDDLANCRKTCVNCARELEIRRCLLTDLCNARERCSREWQTLQAEEASCGELLEAMETRASVSRESDSSLDESLCTAVVRVQKMSENPSEEAHAALAAICRTSYVSEQLKLHMAQKDELSRHEDSLRAEEKSELVNAAKKAAELDRQLKSESRRISHERAAISKNITDLVDKRRSVEHQLRCEMKQLQAALELKSHGVYPTNKEVLTHIRHALAEMSICLVSCQERFGEVVHEQVELRRRLIDAVSHLESSERTDFVMNKLQAPTVGLWDVEIQRHIIATKQEECAENFNRLAECAHGQKEQATAEVQAAEPRPSLCWCPPPTIVEESPLVLSARSS